MKGRQVSFSMFTEERREKIYDLLTNKHRVSVKDLAEQFHISIDSIRRDLSIMESRGLLKRTYGGAIPVVRSKYQIKPPAAARAVPSDEAEPLPHAAAAEQSGHPFIDIAKAAASYVRSGDTIFLGNDPIHFALLHCLPEHLALTVVTNNLLMAEMAKTINHIETYMICGRVQASGDVYDSMASSFVKSIKIDVHFLGGCGVTAGYGVSMPTPEEAAFHRTLAEISRTTICLADQAKIGSELFARMMPVDELDLIITDQTADPNEMERIVKSHTEVVVAPYINE